MGQRSSTNTLHSVLSFFPLTLCWRTKDQSHDCGVFRSQVFQIIYCNLQFKICRLEIFKHRFLHRLHSTLSWQDIWITCSCNLSVYHFFEYSELIYCFAFSQNSLLRVTENWSHVFNVYLQVYYGWHSWGLSKWFKNVWLWDPGFQVHRRLQWGITESHSNAKLNAVEQEHLTAMHSNSVDRCSLPALSFCALKEVQTQDAPKAAYKNTHANADEMWAKKLPGITSRRVPSVYRDKLSILQQVC